MLISNLPIRRALKFMWDLSMEISGSRAWPTNRNGTLMFCSGMWNLQKDSTRVSSWDVNSNETWKTDKALNLLGNTEIIAYLSSRIEKKSQPDTSNHLEFLATSHTALRWETFECWWLLSIILVFTGPLKAIGLTSWIHYSKRSVMEQALIVVK